jgi:predicted Ser/Thr protein kinase
LKDLDVRKALRREYAPITDSVQIKAKKVIVTKEGMSGLSPRKVQDLIGEIIGIKEENDGKHDRLKGRCECLGIHEFHERLEEMVEAGIEAAGSSVTNKRYGNPEHFFESAKIEYDLAVKEDVRWAIIGKPKEEVDQLILSYIKNVHAWIKGDKIKDPITIEYKDPDEELMCWMEDLLGVEDDAERKEHRTETINQLATAQWTAETKAEKEGLKEVPQLDIPELFEDYYDYIYNALFEDAVDEMEVGEDEFKRALGMLGTDNELSIGAQARKEIDKIIHNLKKRQPYCNTCAQAALEYAIFELVMPLD